MYTDDEDETQIYYLHNKRTREKRHIIIQIDPCYPKLLRFRAIELSLNGEVMGN